MDPTTPPIACTLNAAALTDREGAWRAAITDGLISREARVDGVRLAFTASSEASVRALVALEAECCGWFRGAVTSDGDTVTVDLVAAGDGSHVLQTMFDCDQTAAG